MFIWSQIYPYAMSFPCSQPSFSFRNSWSKRHSSPKLLLPFSRIYQSTNLIHTTWPIHRSFRRFIWLNICNLSSTRFKIYFICLYLFPPSVCSTTFQLRLFILSTININVLILRDLRRTFIYCEWNLKTV